jgi:hypothetical protein
MIAYQNGAAKLFGVEAVEHKDDEEYEIAYWFKVRTKSNSRSKAKKC